MITINRSNSYINISNKGIYISNTETILIEANVLGYQSFCFSASNLSGSTISSINIYASADDFNYYSVENNAILSLTVGETDQYTFSSVNKYLRITGVSVYNTNVDCYLIGEI